MGCQTEAQLVKLCHSHQLSELSCGLSPTETYRRPSPELPQFVLERLPVHVQDLGRPGHVALRVLETAADVAAFKLPAVLAKIGGERHRKPSLASPSSVIALFGIPR